MLVKIVNSAASLTVAVIYRPPKPNVSDFIVELADLIDGGILGSRYVICGNLNCPGPTGTRALVNEELKELIDSHSLTQHVQKAICHSGNLLDHILTSQDTVTVKNVVVTDVGISDHCLVTGSLIGRINRPKTVTFSFRKWKQMDLDAFRKRVTLSSVHTQPARPQISSPHSLRRTSQVYSTSWLLSSPLQSGRVSAIVAGCRRRLSRQSRQEGNWNVAGIQPDSTPSGRRIGLRAGLQTA